MTLFLSRVSTVIVKGDVKKSNVFKEFLMTLLSSTLVFLKKRILFDFCHI